MGFDSLDTIKNFDKQAISFIFPKTYLVFSVAPIKNTIEAHKAKEERIRQKEAARVAKGIAKRNLKTSFRTAKLSLKTVYNSKSLRSFSTMAEKLNLLSPVSQLLMTTNRLQLFGMVMIFLMKN